MTIFETIGIAYTILATTFFTIELVYCAVKGVSNGELTVRTELLTDLVLHD